MATVGPRTAPERVTLCDIARNRNRSTAHLR
jgi:hypothetical protein